MTAQHTPGPWSVIDDNGFWQIYGADNFAIHSSFNSTPNAIVIAEANARLIAAAPELLAACEALNDAWRSGIETPQILQIRAAIAKARGQ